MVAILSEPDPIGQLEKSFTTRSKAATFAAVIHQAGIDAKVEATSVIVRYSDIIKNPSANFNRFCDTLKMTGFIEA